MNYLYKVPGSVYNSFQVYIFLRSAISKGICMVFNAVFKFVSIMLRQPRGFLRGLVVEHLTRNPGVLDLSCNRFSGFFVGVSFGKKLQSPSLLLVKPKKDMNDVICCFDMIEKLLTLYSIDTHFDASTIDSF